MSKNEATHKIKIDLLTSKIFTGNVRYMDTSERNKCAVNIAVVPKYNVMQACTGYGGGRGDTLPPSSIHACLYLQEKFVAQCASRRCWNTQEKDNGKTCEVHLRAAACSRMSFSVPRGKLTAEDCMKTDLKVSSKAYGCISHIDTET